MMSLVCGKKIKNSDFEWSRFKGVFVNFEPFISVSLLSGLFAQKALSNTFCVETNFLTKLSHDMTISEFYRTHKLRLNVPRTYLCLIIPNKIGLPPTIG